MRKEYLDKVSLLIETLPYVGQQECFALKGGTAINLFYKDMPRLSVDIDLAYTYFDDRTTAYQRINESLVLIGQALSQAGFSTYIQGNGLEKKVIVSNRSASIKIEPNYIIRGYVYEPMIRGICKKAEKIFGYTEARIVSFPELYGGKICAALDRQHPRDLFDIDGLFAYDVQNPALMEGFIVLLLGHNRPIHELLNPTLKIQSEVFEKEFVGMTDTEFTYEDHIRTFGDLVHYIKTRLHPYKNFLL